MTRKSKYMAGLPPLPVHCTALDGDADTIPLIFEDVYQERSCGVNGGDFNNGKYCHVRGWVVLMGNLRLD